ncbi:hypothetical protein OHV05_36665 (plasmid) [Kitasatospora sp. NBC_00070]|uniref:hypothetical protein n=1 Tax=Kitasatospora sp. NBC_00070 TaxID=2975962 RepID=UPI002F91B5C5
MTAMTVSCLAGSFGQLVMAGWTARVPGAGVLACALLAGCGPRPSALMPSVAAVLGMDPTPGALTRRLRGSTSLALAGDGWAHLSMPGGEHVEYPAFDEWQATLLRERHAYLHVSYLRLPAHVAVEDHLREMTRAGQFATGVVPLV